LSPCHGRLPLKKYMNMCPRASKSSLLLCSESQNNNKNLITGYGDYWIKKFALLNNNNNNNK